MAATPHRLPSCGLSTEAQDKRKRPLLTKQKPLLIPDLSKWSADSCQIDPSQASQSPFIHVHTGGQYPLWMDGWPNPSCGHGELGVCDFIGDASPDTLSTAQINSYVASLRACTRHKDLVRGTRIHLDLTQKRLVEKCSDALVTMYAKCGELEKAKALLDANHSTDVITWTSIIAGYVRAGQGHDALACLQQMQHGGILPNAVTYVCSLKACAIVGEYSRGKKIHDAIAREGMLSNDRVLGNALVDMYAKCGVLSEARRVLKELPSRDVVSWSALIAGYAQEGEAEKALNCLDEMQHEGIPPNAVTYVSALKACTIIRAAERGKRIHKEIAEQGFLDNDVVLGNALVNMYAKCGDVSKAHQLLEELPFRDIFSWNVLVTGYAQEGQGELALNCLTRMHNEGIIPDTVTYGSALKACAVIQDINTGKQIHNKIITQGLLKNDLVLGNALVDMYTKCGDISEAHRVLRELPSRDVISWSALIAGLAQEGQAEQALSCYQQMQSEGILPDAGTCACLIKLCSHQGLVAEGQSIFLNMSIKYGVMPTLDCYTSMIDLLGRAGHLEKAVSLAQETPSGYISIWHTLLGACRKWADVNVGRWAFEQAMTLDISDNSVHVLMADICAAAGMEEEAKSIEAIQMRNKGWKKPRPGVWRDFSNAVIESPDMDAKRGKIDGY